MLQLELIANFIRTLLAPLREAILLVIPPEWAASIPAMTLVIFSFIVLLWNDRRGVLGVSLVGVFVTAFNMILFDSGAYPSSFGGLFVRDSFADFFIWIILIVAVLILMSATLYGGERSSYNFLLLMSFAGAIWVVMATDLVALFLAWELMSTPTYVLVALGPYRGSVDGATKYFVMGLLSTMVMVFGIALVIGVTGSTALAGPNSVAAAVEAIWASTTPGPEAYSLLLSMVMFAIAFGFKVGIFPGWMWVPDAYSTADGSVTGYLAGATKKTGISALMRILMVGFFVARMEWMLLIVVVSLLTMVIGNVLALAERNIMRMLAYSSIVMMGFVFVGIAAGTQFGAAAAMFHAFTHALMKTGAFILVWAMSIRLAKEITYEDLAGLSQRAPMAAALFAVLIFALAGGPLTVGFWSKWILLPQSAVESGLWWFALLALFNSVFSLGYYLRVLRYMYMMDPVDSSEIKLAKIPMVAVALCAIAIIGLFVFPGIVLDYAFEGAAALIP
jgi:NADH-quinone oxidoreductase subunit N